MSEKIINIKNVLTLMLICCFLWINGITVHAESQAVNEKEPNNTKAEKANSEGTELDIGKIIQELGRILNELKGVLNEFARTRN